MEGNFHPRKIHFMGIGGSGISGIAVLAKKSGYEVEGCDLEKKTDYLDKVKKENVKAILGHDKKHVDHVDLVVVSPAILYVNSNHPEVIESIKKGKLLTWEEFLAKYLHNDHEVLCIAGTHGKSTTTAMLGTVLETAGLDPSVTIGASAKEWNANFRKGDGNYFITEADEFNNNFLAYNPSAIILNNVEMDHADFFRDELQVFRSFSKFIQKLNGKKILIVNQDSWGVNQVLGKVPKVFLNNLNIYGYTLKSKPLIKLKYSVKISIQKADENGTSFSLFCEPLNIMNDYFISIPGEFNVQNATGVVISSKLYGISNGVVKKALEDFKGVGRRLELIGEKNGIKVYDDYAHHPTAIKATLSALRQKYPKNRIWAINEPHSYSRTNALLQEYDGVFDEADKVIIAPIFKARDNETFGISENMLVESTHHADIQYIDNFPDIVGKLSTTARSGDVVLVMGAGKSYLLARDILKNL